MENYAEAWDELFSLLPPGALRGLHHTRLNLGATRSFDGALADFTNALVGRYRIAHVNEDIGIWHLLGKVLPYPLPPPLTDGGLALAVDNARAWRAALRATLRVEFPGFSDGASFVVGRWHAYDWFREVIVRSGADATLDVGHLLGWQWSCGRRGAALYDELDRLPLDSCVEIHLSGCAIAGGRFVDAHHGVLLDMQLALLERLLSRCPGVELVTYEDPKFDENGALFPRTVPGFERLRDMVRA